MDIENIILAIIIGDGHIDKKGSIKLHHSIKQVEWFNYKVKLLEKAGFKVNCYVRKQMSYGEIRTFVKGETNTNCYTKALRKFFYPDGKKILPKNMFDNFGFEELSIIFQDDGRQNKIAHYNTIKKGEKVKVESEPFVNRYEIATQCFDYDSFLRLKEYLLHLGINSTSIKVKSGGLITSISKADSKIIFYEGIKKYVIPSMKYKLSASPTLSYRSKLIVND